MGQARTLSISLTGLEGTLVEVEADVSQGLPAFSLVGLPDSSTLLLAESDGEDSAGSPSNNGGSTPQEVEDGVDEMLEAGG